MFISETLTARSPSCSLIPARDPGATQHLSSLKPTNKASSLIPIYLLFEHRRHRADEECDGLHSHALIWSAERGRGEYFRFNHRWSALFLAALQKPKLQ